MTCSNTNYNGLEFFKNSFIEKNLLSKAEEILEQLDQI